MKKFSDIQLVREYKGIPAGRVFNRPKNKLYKILGFDIDGEKVEVWAVRLLRKTFKPSPKQPIAEIFKFEDIQDQEIKISTAKIFYIN